MPAAGTVYRRRFNFRTTRGPGLRRRRGATRTAASFSAGVASFVSSGPGGIVMTATDASGGTLPYTYQWQRNTDGGSYSDLSNGGGVSGATTLTLTDGSAAAGHIYGYRLAYTDSAGSPATATSNAVTAAVYTGGALSGGSPLFGGGLVR